MELSCDKTFENKFKNQPIIGVQFIMNNQNFH